MSTTVEVLLWCCVAVLAAISAIHDSTIKSLTKALQEQIEINNHLLSGMKHGAEATEKLAKALHLINLEH